MDERGSLGTLPAPTVRRQYEHAVLALVGTPDNVVFRASCTAISDERTSS